MVWGCWGNGGGCGEVGTLEVCGSKVRDTGADSCAELGEGLLDLVGIVVAFGLVNAGDPTGSDLCSAGTLQGVQKVRLRT